MIRKISALLLSGGVTPLLGVGIYLLQLQVNPRGIYVYLLVQCLISFVFLAYFFGMGYLCSKTRPIRAIKLWFFLIPFGITFISFVHKLWLSSNIPAAVVLSGIEVPFHYLLTYLYYFAGPYYPAASFFPILICFFSFHLGETLWKERLKRRTKI